MKNKFYIYIILAVFFVSCQNEDWDFPDFDYQTVYFAHQYPVRTITLGEDIFDTSMDNEWKFRIMATTGGVYSNNADIRLDFTVDNSLLEGVVFGDSGEEIRPMPSTYYGILSENIIIPRGSLIGGVEIQLTEAFFNDPLAIRNTYVIPMVISNVVNADSILSGNPLVNNPRKIVEADWVSAPKDFTLYAVKYINPWHGFYLRRGVDVITGKNGNNDLNDTVIRRAEYVEQDEINNLNTYSLRQVEFPLSFQDSGGQNIQANLLLTFDAEENCTVTAASGDFTASGTGSFVKRGERNSWGAQDRDALYLNYQIDLEDMNIQVTDTLVMRNRGVAMETFSPMLR
ncbi:DUF5627 domain-containing protein [Anditalea andensis]|uniref:Adhesin n=1 Tax=Anditalea andensis TaxID=1048983 RepID=A0A074KUX7_9BACT|nr:DUF5627 domain-containing protein [Anditalea andensis]KEO73781.1 adhesin [Anditalea andensis]